MRQRGSLGHFLFLILFILTALALFGIIEWDIVGNWVVFMLIIPVAGIALISVPIFFGWLSNENSSNIDNTSESGFERGIKSIRGFFSKIFFYFKRSFQVLFAIIPLAVICLFYYFEISSNGLTIFIENFSGFISSIKFLGINLLILIIALFISLMFSSVGTHYPDYFWEKNYWVFQTPSFDQSLLKNLFTVFLQLLLITSILALISLIIFSLNKSA